MKDQRHRARSVASVIAAGVTMALAMTGCTAQDSSESASQAAAFPEVYSQSINWGECDDSFDLSDSLADALGSHGVPVDTYRCGMIEAPYDWNDPENSETIQLAAVHIPSTGKDAPIGTLLGNPGGPGEGGLAYAYTLPASPGFAEVLDNYDLLGFDPRGIGRSTPTGCEAKSSITELNIAWCAAEAPIALTMGTSQVARDMELLRSLMGDDSMHYLGYSYGTVLGATYSTLFPEKVGRMVLDSAIPSNWASLTGSFNQTVAIVHEVDALLSGCGDLYEVSACPLLDSTRISSSKDLLAVASLAASDGTELTGHSLFEYLISALYQGTVGRELALETLTAALAQDQASIDAIALDQADGGSNVDLDGVLVRCHSFPTDPNLPELVDHITEVGLPEALGGPEITDESLMQWVNLACDALPNSGDDITDSFSGSADAPILVIGLLGDHATPYAGSQQLVDELGNATLLTLDSVGHGGSYQSKSSCVDKFTTAYLLKGTLPAKGTVCQTGQ
ncbi:MAG: alpha/beta hydrolase [Rhodoglobus sp.]